MSLFTWDNKYSIGLPQVDAEHKRLFELAGHLHDGMLNKSGKENTSRTLNALIQYTREHFEHEEKMMLQNNYPDYAAHKVEHDKLTRKVLEFQKGFESGQLALNIQLLQFLQEWLQTHICGTDHKISVYMRTRQKPRQPVHA